MHESYVDSEEYWVSLHKELQDCEMIRDKEKQIKHAKKNEMIEAYQSIYK